MGFMDRLKGMQEQASSAMQMPTQDDLAMMNRVTRLNSVGVESPATITAMESTGRTDPGGGVEHRFDVTVSPAGAAPYAAQFTQFMHMGSMAGWAYQGADVKVRVDPEDPSSMILWGGA